MNSESQHQAAYWCLVQPSPAWLLQWPTVIKLTFHEIDIDCDVILSSSTAGFVTDVDMKRAMQFFIH